MEEQKKVSEVNQRVKEIIELGKSFTCEELDKPLNYTRLIYTELQESRPKTNREANRKISKIRQKYRKHYDVLRNTSLKYLYYLLRMPDHRGFSIDGQLLVWNTEYKGFELRFPINGGFQGVRISHLLTDGFLKYDVDEFIKGLMFLNVPDTMTLEEAYESAIQGKL